MGIAWYAAVSQCYTREFYLFFFLDQQNLSAIVLADFQTISRLVIEVPQSLAKASGEARVRLHR